MLEPPVEPMLAKPLGSVIPDATAEVSFEPKWDGFRCLAFRSEEGVVLQGRGRSRGSADDVVDLAYAFPELVDAITAQVPPGTVLDGEIVVPHRDRLDFSALSSRLRPRSEAGGPEHRPPRRVAAGQPADVRRALVAGQCHGRAIRARDGPCSRCWPPAGPRRFSSRPPPRTARWP